MSQACLRQAGHADLQSGGLGVSWPRVSPETIAHYRLEAPLGESCRGVVYRAVAQDTNRTVALKVLTPDRCATPAYCRKFLQEARKAARVSHPNLRQLYEVGECGDRLYLAMEYLEGSTLKNLLVAGALDLEAALAWGAEIAEALAAAHAQGIVHGDLRPARVFITTEGTVKVLDAGLWRLGVPIGVDLSQEAKLTGSGVRAAAVAALAPEQIRGQEPDAGSDIFTLGRLLYEMTTGVNPFADQSPLRSMYWVLDRTPAPASQVSPQVSGALDPVLARALEKEPKARYRDAGELAGALRAVAAGEALPVESPRRVALRLTTPLWFGIGGLVALLVLWFVYLALTRP